MLLLDIPTIKESQFLFRGPNTLAIGKEGQNARLAARLTSWKIDIKSQSQVDEQVEAEAGEAPTVEGDAE